MRLGSFFTALVYLSAEVGAVLEGRHPDLFRRQEQVIHDELVDRATAFARLANGELDVAIVFEHGFEPDPAPDDIEIVHLFTDPPTALLPAGHRLAGFAAVAVTDLAHDTWIRAHHGSAARLVDHVLHQAGLQPTIELAGHGDEPAEAQAFVAAGHGVTVAHHLNVLISPEQITVARLVDDASLRHIQAAIMRENRSPAARAVIDALREVGRRRAQQHSIPRPATHRHDATGHP